ncbi:MAG: hemerythrin family protein [Ruminococcus sp.]|jgi:hemerythrin-like metal-binding protein|nr:hemerythrin family protein [Ruminococcus sp.]
MYNWNESWATGNTLIDSEHKELFKAIDAMLEACQSGKGKDHLKKTMDFLKSYTAKHFADEEKLQQQSGYPDFQNHRKIHEGFKKYVAEICAQFEKEGPSIKLVGLVNLNIGDWLIKHIQREDVKIALHIKSQGK